MTGFTRRVGCPRGLLVGLLGILALASSSSGFAQVHLPQADADWHGLPYFDARLGPDELPTPGAAEVLAKARAGPRPARTAAVAGLQASIPQLMIDEHPVYGTPHFVRSTTSFLTQRSKLDAAQVVVEFVGANEGLFEVGPPDLKAARLTRDYETRHNRVRHLTWQQRVEGIDLFGCELRANVMPDGRLINISSSMLPLPAGFRPEQPAVTDTQALAYAAEACGITLAQPCAALSQPEGRALARSWRNPPELRADHPITTSLILFAKSREDIRIAWKTTIPAPGIGHTYDVIIDASARGAGELLYRHNRLCFDSTQPITMRVYTTSSPAPGSPGRPTPDGVQYRFVARTLLTISPEEVLPYSPNHWIDDGDTSTLGNNVHAHADVDGNNIPDLPRPDGGASRTFDLALDLSQPPSTYTGAAIVQMFYYANVYHDRLMALGFDEGAGNFQQINFSPQGVGGDPVQAEVQDNAQPIFGNPSVNNANFVTGPDGSTGRCQMYLFNGPTPQRDGTLDGQIVFHELTHGTSVRLHGGSLAGTQPQAMGEGWSDFFGIAMFAQPDDDPDGVYPFGSYCTYHFAPYAPTYDNNYYFGMRRFPYSTDPLKNPQTYADIDTGQQSYPDHIVPRNTAILNTANELHNAGEVWCNTLMEVRSALWAAHGFEGNQRALQLVVDGMKLSPPNPNFLQSRDAIIQADLVDSEGADRNRLWRAFAKRGMGYYAISPAGTSTFGIVESFDMPYSISFVYPQGRPERLEPGVVTPVEVTITPFNLEVVPGSAHLFCSRAGGPFIATPMNHLGDDLYGAALPAAFCSEDVAFYIRIETSEGAQSDPPGAPASSHHASVVHASTIVSDGFETEAPGWHVGPGSPPATAGIWTRMVPQATGAQPGSAHQGQKCWITDGNAGASIGAGDVDGGQTILTSPEFELPDGADAEISYWRWYSNNQGQHPGTNTLLVEASTDEGQTWSAAEVVGPDNHINNRWTFASWKLSDIALAPASTLRIRFIAQDLTGAIVEAAIDELTITALSCADPCGTSDFDLDGDFGTDADIEAFFACLAGDCCPACFPGGADFNADGDTGTDADIEAFFRVLAGGAC